MTRGRPLGVTLFLVSAMAHGGASHVSPPDPCGGADSPTSPVQLNHFLEGSPLAGFGHAFYNAGVANGIDPRLLVALAYAESSDGRHITRGDANNIFNWEYNGKHHSPYRSIEAAIDSLAAGLNEGYFENLDDDYRVYGVFCKRPCWYGRRALRRALRALQCDGKSKEFPCGSTSTSSVVGNNSKQAVR
ncbi:MAG TPA: hypothetical protein VHZ07_10160 [Bryobacteraceae bacterium]|nr:hypothetical protein [Bryobacteraceae bacterium]